ncbi:MAG: YifB family Mg chelatase-like AAA ATPase [bacterium]
MSLARTYSGLVDGVEGEMVTVEVHLDQGLPGVHIVGLPDQAVKESRKRIRPAVKESGFKFPNQKITINLSPADKAKKGSTYDLPITIGILLASDQLEVTQGAIEKYMFAGEIALDGTLSGIPGVLPLSLKAEEENFESFMVPRENALEAGPADVQNSGIRHLREAVGVIEGRAEPPDDPDPDSADQQSIPDFGDVKGQRSAKRALSIAAAGSHNALMMGPPGTGKSMLARRLPGILPPLNEEQSLETTSVHSVAGQLMEKGKIISTPPFRSPHHTTSGAGLIGGGRIPKPGEVSLAHNGVLFLDELPEFNRSDLETLRQPMETGEVQVSRARASYTFPAKFLLVGAMNPCPCGYMTHPDKECICRPTQIDNYHQKLSGPLLDRIDIHLSVGPVDYDELTSESGNGEATVDIRKRVIEARKRQYNRYRDEDFSVNAHLSASDVEHYCEMTDSAESLLKESADRSGYSARTIHRLKKVSRTLADYQDRETIEDEHMAEALQHRELEESRWRG